MNFYKKNFQKMGYMKRSFSVDDLCNDLKRLSVKSSNEINSIYSEFIKSLIKLSVASTGNINHDNFNIGLLSFTSSIPEPVHKSETERLCMTLSDRLLRLGRIIPIGTSDPTGLYKVLGEYFGSVIYASVMFTTESDTPEYITNIEVMKERRSHLGMIPGVVEKIGRQCLGVTGVEYEHILRSIGVDLSYGVKGKIFEKLKEIAKPFLIDLAKGYGPLVKFVDDNFNDFEDPKDFNDKFILLYESIKDGTYASTESFSRRYVFAEETLPPDESEPIEDPPPVPPPPSEDPSDFLKNFSPYGENNVTMENLSKSIVRASQSLSGLSHQKRLEDPREADKLQAAAEYILQQLRNVSGNSYSKLLLMMYIFFELKY